MLTLVAPERWTAPGCTLETPPAAPPFTEGFTIRLATTLEERRRAWALVYEVYLEEGYVTPNAQALWYGTHDADPRTITFLVERGGQAAAALTVVFDAQAGLPADRLCKPELDRMRGAGRRLCQIVNLASRIKGVHGAALVKHLFKCAYLAARCLEGATDFVTTVNARHSEFYERILRFTLRSGPLAHKDVHAAVVFLGLDLETAEAQYRAHYDGLPGDRNLYRFFLQRACEWKEWIRQHRRPLDASVVWEYFVERRSLLTVEQFNKTYSTQGTYKDFAHA